MEEATLFCRYCDTPITPDDNAGTDDLPLCHCCREDYYTTCDRCGALLFQEDAHNISDGVDEALCDTCYDAWDDERVIQDYCYKPLPIFYGKGPRYFGVELEIDQGGESNRNAQTVLDITNAAQELAYCKHDGSLDDGFEIVTHPMSREFHETQMPWEEVVEKAVSLGYTSHQSGTCGLHVHVSRDAFGEDEEQQDERIARVLYFFEKHWEELLKFSRRTETQLKRWAARYGYKEHPMEILDQAKKGYGGGRYSSVNLQNRDTIEFRMFRGTLKYNTLIATLQMVDHICDVAVFLSDEQMKALSWTNFVSAIQEPELVQYLNERRLYVNEPVSVGEEV